MNILRFISYVRDGEELRRTDFTAQCLAGKSAADDGCGIFIPAAPLPHWLDAGSQSGLSGAQSIGLLALHHYTPPFLKSQLENIRSLIVV